MRPKKTQSIFIPGSTEQKGAICILKKDNALTTQVMLASGLNCHCW